MVASIVWAALILIIVLLFKEPLAGILTTIAHVGHRTKNLSYKNFNIVLGSDSQLPIGQQENSQFITLQKTYQSPIITSEENLILSQLRDAKLSSEQANHVLIYHLAHAQFLIKLLGIDKIIFPEQIRLLFYLNTRNLPEPQTSLLPFYQQWQTNNPNIPYSSDAFLNFLSQQGLIRQDLNGYTITLLGKEYLAALVKVGSPSLSIIASTQN